MDNKNKKSEFLSISQKDLKLLLLFLSVAILASAYYFIFTKKMEQAKEVKNQNLELEQKVLELSNRQMNVVNTKAKTKDLEIQNQLYFREFPNTVTTDETILFLKTLEEIGDMEISTASFSESEIFYSYNDKEETAAQEDEAVEQEEGSIAAEEPEISEEQVGNAFTAYRTKVIFTFQSSYEGWKRVISFISQLNGRKSFDTFSLNYAPSNGLLSGSAELYLYTMQSLHTESAYYPDFSNIRTGKSNLFGTLEK